MDGWVGYAPWLAAMGSLLFASGFFSASEAALFSLTPRDRRQMASGTKAQQTASRLLRETDQLLTTVLFGNLLVNVLYFTIASIVGLQLRETIGPTSSGTFALAALVTLILLSEVLPKSLAVLQPRWVASWVSLPLEMLIRLINPLLPVFHQMVEISQRVLCPRFEPEPYLHLRDLERAVELSAGGASWVQQEQEILQSLVLLSEMRVDELMCPRSQLITFRAPVLWKDIQDRLPPNACLFLTDPRTEEITAAVCLREWNPKTAPSLIHPTEEVLYVPWCITVAEALEQMLRQNRLAAVVVNEYGETIGAITFEDVLESLFRPTSSRSERLLHRPPLRQVRPGVWEATGMTSLRRVARHFRIERPPGHATTVAGLFLEKLGRFPAPGDTCRWGPLEFRVLHVGKSSQMSVEIQYAVPEHSP